VCKESIAGRADTVHEQQIGTQVYGRKADYNPSEDNIVRVEARRLRKELETYFSEEGSGEPLLVKIPKGSYHATFEPRETLTPDPSDEPSRRKDRRRWYVLGAFGILAAGSLLLWSAMKARPEVPEPVTAVWPHLLDTQNRTAIVLADAGFALLQDVLGREIPFHEYANRGYMHGLKDPVSILLAQRRSVGFSATVILAKFLQSESCPRDKIVVRHARNLTIRDFQADNHILLGSRHSNPWTELFRDKHNFQAGFDWGSRLPFYRNKSPLAGEKDVYFANADKGEQYSLVTYLPNLTNTGKVLIIEGTSAEGTEGALDFLLNPSNNGRFLGANTRSNSRNMLPYFEVLLLTRAMGGAPVSTTYVTHRHISAR
jgi:hypothetical protein